MSESPFEVRFLNENGEALEEPSLTLVENQEYVNDTKGAINIYGLQKAIREERVNKALRRFLTDWKTANGKLKLATNRYVTTQDLLGYFREVTPGRQQHILEELFESVDENEIN